METKNLEKDRSKNRKTGKVRNISSKKVNHNLYFKRIIAAIFATSNPLLWLCLYNSVLQIKNFAIVFIGVIRDTSFK